MHRASADEPVEYDHERGFTLIDLIVVMLIIGVLIAIAITAFLGAKSRAQAKSAQSSLGNAATSSTAIYTDASSYSTATVAALTKAEPGLSFATTVTASTVHGGFRSTRGVQQQVAPPSSGQRSPPRGCAT